MNNWIKNLFGKPAAWVFIIGLISAFYVGKYVPPTWTVETIAINAYQLDNGQLAYTYKKKPKAINTVVPIANASLTCDRIDALNKANQRPAKTSEFVQNTDGSITQYKVTRHWKYWSLLPAIIAIMLCWIVKEPITALSGGIITGAFLMGQFNILDNILIPNFMSKSAATVLLLYLWLLGGLMGLWAKTGASKAFAEFMTKHFVKGPKSAKLVAWMLGVIFFQGGTVSAVLVGTTVKPLADEEKVSHEELSFIVDSTSSPIAILLPFNAWPGYVQAFTFVAGVSWLATDADRIAFFFKSIPLNFYAIFAILSTFLLSIEKLPWQGKKLGDAIKRARSTGRLDAPHAEPLVAKSLSKEHVPKHYKANIADFFVPLFVVLGVAIGTYITMGSPKVLWAFGAALMVGIVMAYGRGMKVSELMDGLTDGLKSVVLGSVILLLAMTIGNISKAAGGGVYLVDLLGGWIPFWSLPVILAGLTMIIAFATGTSWGTFAVAFPLALPLAAAVGTAKGLGNPEFFMLICFCAILNGSVYGDQCSPISDTTVLSAMTTGCDLMDHVKTQIPLASVSMGLAVTLWTLLVLIFA